MKIGLASYRCENRDMQFNIRQIERAMKETRGKADLLCFGEAFLQGFDSLCWDYEKDRHMAVEQSSETILYLRKLTERYGQALLTGYIEKEQDRLYSSCIVLALCGDLWDAPERFKTDHLLIWPVYVNYTPEEWENGALDEYAEQALLVSGDTLMINPIDRNPVNHGGSFRFRDGTVTERIPYDEEQILIVDIP